MELIRELGFKNVGKKGERKRYGLYKCSFCDNTKAAIVTSVKNGHTKSCGCRERVTHGLSKHECYQIWGAMKDRCNNTDNPYYKYYGGRGISVCEEWQKSFVNFINDMGERPNGMTLDRVDNDKGYDKGNCRWATMQKQLNNTSRNRFIKEYGVRLTVAEWSRVLEVPHDRIRGRLKKGWSNHDALFLPKKVNQYNNGESQITGE